MANPIPTAPRRCSRCRASHAVSFDVSTSAAAACGRTPRHRDAPWALTQLAWRTAATAPEALLIAQGCKLLPRLGGRPARAVAAGERAALTRLPAASGGARGTSVHPSLERVRAAISPSRPPVAGTATPASVAGQRRRDVRAPRSPRAPVAIREACVRDRGMDAHAGRVRARRSGQNTRRTRCHDGHGLFDVRQYRSSDDVTSRS